MSKLSQKEMVLRHLEAKGSINPMTALSNYSCYRLSDVIFRLRKDGYKISTKLIDTRNKLGGACHYAEYTLQPPETLFD